jgi:hypothetical protein
VDYLLLILAAIVASLLASLAAASAFDHSRPSPSGPHANRP